MDDLLSFLYTVIDTLSLVFFLDAFATRRWDNWKFKLGVGCFVALLFWVLQVPFVFFGRDQAMKIGMILLSYTISARVLYKEISDKMLLLLVCIEYLVTYYLSFGLGMMGAFICGMDGESFRTNFSVCNGLRWDQLFNRTLSGIYISTSYEEKKLFGKTQ